MTNLIIVKNGRDKQKVKAKYLENAEVPVLIMPLKPLSF